MELVTQSQDPTVRALSCMEPMMRPIIRSIISSLSLPQGSHGLDVGCGIGTQMGMFVDAIGPNGHIAGLDISGPVLEIAELMTSQAGFANQVSYKQGSWDHIPFADASFDWVWSMDAAGYAPSDPLITLRELVRVIKPGGKLILANWSSQSLLPGYPVLEAHLNATSVGIAPFSRDSQPNSHFLYSLSWMRELGLEDAHAETFVHTVFAPLAPEIQRALIALIDMRWASAQAEVSPGDWQLYLRLSKPDSPEFILNNPGYLAFFTYSVFSAKVPE